MAEFNTNLTPAKGEGAQALSPVAPTDFSGAARTISSVFDGISRNKASQAKAERQALEDAVVGEFVKESLTLQDAFITGSMSASEVNTRSRSIYGKYAAAYPHLTDSLSKANKNIKGDTSLGESFDFEQAADDALKAEIASARASGVYIGPDMSPGQVEEQLNTWRQDVATEKELERIRKSNQEARAQAQEDRAATEYRNKNESSRLLADLGARHQQSLISTVTSLTNRARQGEDPTVLNLELQTQLSRLEQGLNAVANTNPELAGPYRTMFQNIAETGRKAINGEIDASAFENQKKNLINRAAIIGLADPHTRALAATQSLVPGTPILDFAKSVGVPDIMNNIVKGIAGEPGVGIIQTPEGIKAAGLTVKQGLDQLRNGNTAAREDTKKLINSMLKQTQAADFLDLSAEHLNGMASFIASPDYAYALENGMISPESVEGAKRVLQIRYQQPIVKSAIDKLSGTANLGFDNPEVMMGDLVDISFRGDKLVFVPGPGEELSPELALTIKSELRNSEKALTQVVHMAAHLEGRTDYAKYWEENRHNIMPDLYLDPKHIGTVVNGYEYLGGNTNKSTSYMFVGDSERSQSGKIKK